MSISPRLVRFAAADMLEWRLAAASSRSAFPSPSSPPMLNRGVAVQQISFLLNIIRFISRNMALSGPVRTQQKYWHAIEEGQRSHAPRTYYTRNNSYSTLQRANYEQYLRQFQRAPGVTAGSTSRRYITPSSQAGGAGDTCVSRSLAGHDKQVTTVDGEKGTRRDIPSARAFEASILDAPRTVVLASTHRRDNRLDTTVMHSHTHREQRALAIPAEQPNNTGPEQEQSKRMGQRGQR